MKYGNSVKAVMSQQGFIAAFFIKQAEKYGIINIKGHRAIGGMRASLYNAMPIEGVQHLVEFMRKFENGGGYCEK